MTAAYITLDAANGQRWYAARRHGAGYSAPTPGEAHVFDFDPDLPHHCQPAFAIASPLWKHATKYGPAYAHILPADGVGVLARLEMNTAGVIRVVAPAVTP